MSRFRIVPDRSRVFIGARSSFHPIEAATSGLEGYVDLEFGPDGRLLLGANPSAELSLPARLLSAGNRLEDRELHRRIDARRYPEIKGVLADITEVADGRYKVSGEVTFRGVSNRHEDEMSITVVDERTVQLEGRSRFDLRAYGMEPPRMLSMRVEPEVDVGVEIVAVKEAIDA